MLKIIIVAVMVGIGQGGERNLFVFTEPSFNTVEECVSYVQNNVQEITGLPNHMASDLLNKSCVQKKTKCQ